VSPSREFVPPVEDVLFGVHAVMEAIAASPERLERILIARETGGARLGELLRAARAQGIPVTHVPRAVLARKVGRSAVSQGVAALRTGAAYADPDNIVRAALAGRGLLVVLDGVEDPRNLGAVLRSAAAAGADGVLLGTEATVGLTPAAVKTSAGVAARIPVGREPRLPRRLRALREAGFTLAALDARGDTPWDRAVLAGPLAIVAGGEQRGLRPGVVRVCNLRVAVPLERGVESLNLSVAVAVVLFEAVRQRRAFPTGSTNSGGRS